jgi:hypothetical protein
MPFREFGKNDLFYNQVKTFPKSDFLIYDSKVYFNGVKHSQGEFGILHGAPQGFISLYELNVDRQIDTGTGAPPDGKSIYPFITKDGARIAFKTVSTSEFDTTSQFAYGDVIKGDYPLTSSIKRIRLNDTDADQVEMNSSERFAGSFIKLTSNKRFVTSLKNTFNEYAHMSKQYEFVNTEWNKGTQEMSLVEIPSIFYGSSIRKGSVVLQVFVTGALAAECRDIKKNGELIQVSGTYNATTDNKKVAGVILYNEGFLSLTGSWDLSEVVDRIHGQDNQKPRWVDFAEGANETGGPAAGTLDNVMFRLSFEGVNYVPTITMLAHAPKGEINNSTNPTVFVKSQVRDPSNDGTVYREFSDLEFSKLEHSDYVLTGSFKKQTYISKVGIYDDQRRLIGIAKLANPVRKTEDREYTFKLKLDI